MRGNSSLQRCECEPRECEGCLKDQTALCKACSTHDGVKEEHTSLLIGNGVEHMHTLPLHCPHFHKEKAQRTKSRGHHYFHLHDDHRVDMVEVFSDPMKERADEKNTMRVMAMIALTGSFMVVELVVGLISGSLALVADSFHMLSDLGALIIGLLTIRATRRARNSKKLVDLSWVRIEAFGGLVNSTTLLALTFFVVLEAVTKFIEKPTIENPSLVLVVGAIGLAITVLGVALFLVPCGEETVGEEEEGEEGESCMNEEDFCYDEYSDCDSDTSLDGAETHGDGVHNERSRDEHTLESDGKLPLEVVVVTSSSPHTDTDSSSPPSPAPPLSGPPSSSSASSSSPPLPPALTSNGQSPNSAAHKAEPPPRHHIENLHGGEAAGKHDSAHGHARGHGHGGTRTHTHGDHAHTHGDHTHTHGDHTHTHGKHIHTHGKQTRDRAHGVDTNHGHGHAASHKQEGGGEGEARVHNHTKSHAHSHNPREGESSILHSHSHAGGGGHSHANMNIQGMLLHIFGDALGSVAVMASAFIIMKTGWVYADPVCSLIISALILFTTVPLTVRTSKVLLGQVPESVDLVRIEMSLDALTSDGIHVKHYNVFTFMEGAVVCWCLVLFEPDVDVCEGIEKVSQILWQNGVQYCTVQPQIHHQEEGEGEKEHTLVGLHEESRKLSHGRQALF